MGGARLGTTNIAQPNYVSGLKGKLTISSVLREQPETFALAIYIRKPPPEAVVWVLHLGAWSSSLAAGARH